MPLNPSDDSSPPTFNCNKSGHAIVIDTHPEHFILPACSCKQGREASMESGAPETCSAPIAPLSGDPPSDTPRAPRHGLNAKALLMQAAALAAEEAANMEETVPGTLSAQDQQIAQLKSTFTSSSKLLAGVPKRETPIVAFVNHTKVSQARCTCAPGKNKVLQDSSTVNLDSCSADPSIYPAAGVGKTGGSTFGDGSY